MLKRIWMKFWSLLNEEKSFKAIVFLTGIVGTGIVTIVGGGWVAFTWYYEKMETSAEVELKDPPNEKNNTTPETPSNEQEENASEPNESNREGRGESQVDTQQTPAREPLRNKFFIVPSDLVDKDSFLSAGGYLRAGEIAVFDQPLDKQQIKVVSENFSSWDHGEFQVLVQFQTQMEVVPRDGGQVLIYYAVKIRMDDLWRGVDSDLEINTYQISIDSDWLSYALAFAEARCAQLNTQAEPSIVTGMEYTTANSKPVTVREVLFNCSR